jgi:hypothetical protein
LCEFGAKVQVILDELKTDVKRGGRLDVDLKKVIFLRGKTVPMGLNFPKKKESCSG